MTENIGYKVALVALTITLVTVVLLYNVKLNNSNDDFKYELIEDLFARKKETYSHPLVEYQKWTVNFNILQFSSFIFLLNNTSNKIRVETLFAFGFVENEGTIDDTFIHKKIQCAFKNRETGVIRIFDSTRVKRLFTKPIGQHTYRMPWKAICEIELLDNLSQWNVGLIDIEQQYEKKVLFDLTTQQMNEILQYQQPKIIDTTQVKKKAIGHCVHGVYDLNEFTFEKLIKWLKFQKEIGYKEINMYIFDDATNVTNYVYKHFDTSFVHIVQHQLSYEGVCEWYIENLHQNPHDALAIFLNNYCKTIYTRSFMFTKGETDETKYIHARLDTNDCYLQLKYKYEYTTNFDFDEFLVPRKFEPFTIAKNKTFINCDVSKTATPHYDVYDYVNKLFIKFDHAEKNLSSLEFDDIPYYTDDERMRNLIMDLKKHQNQKPNDTVEVKYIKTIMPQNYDAPIFYIIKPEDYDYVVNLVKMYDMYHCMRNLTIRSNFNAAITSAYNLPYHPGKSIFKTDFIDFTSLHYGESLPMSASIKVPIETAFVGHFRDKTTRYHNWQKVSIRHFTIDFEYYNFFLKHFN